MAGRSGEPVVKMADFPKSDFTANLAPRHHANAIRPAIVEMKGETKAVTTVQSGILEKYFLVVVGGVETG